ncbi:unnamed protein product [Caenorhabditis auriculariae]|uniref:AMMECR1 domain-containing protein n=1 Tax=Caenorhabditis auriculariae TaxID=2777116 RepID=A0A8S1HTF8_9PELO|nr:unnamed protein product [Caenorhabditis auriculariae]
MAIATADMTVFCFDVIESKLSGRKDPPAPSSIPPVKLPLFVTWKVGSHNTLRGCIGTFSELNLQEGLRDYAKVSAFEDHRFKPIRKDEVSSLSCGVSLLINFEPALDYRDWTIGTHGVRIHFSDGRSQLSAVFLPEVAAEQGWNHLETIDALIAKAGHRGKVDENLRMSLRVVRFQSSKFVMSYAEYLQHKRDESSR